MIKLFEKVFVAYYQSNLGLLQLNRTLNIMRKISIYNASPCCQKATSPRCQKATFVFNIDLLGSSYEFGHDFLQDQVHVLRNQFQYLNNDIFLQNFHYRQLNVANWQRQENWSISPKYVKFSSLVSSAWYFGHASIKLKTLA